MRMRKLLSEIKRRQDEMKVEGRNDSILEKTDGIKPIARCKTEMMKSSKVFKK